MYILEKENTRGVVFSKGYKLIVDSYFSEMKRSLLYIFTGVEGVLLCA
jgi:hypothetical protein